MLNSVIDGSLFHPQVHKIKLIQINKSPWNSDVKVELTIDPTLDIDGQVNVVEEVRTRLVSLLTIITEADVSATDEIVLNVVDKKDVIILRRGGYMPIKQRKSIVQTHIDFKEPISEKLWMAITRFRKVLVSASSSEQFEALVGTIDILGQIDFPTLSRKVCDRMRRILTEGLNVELSLAEQIILKRHEKIHENVINEEMRNMIYPLKAKVLKNLAERLGLKLASRPIEISGDIRIHLKN